MLYRSLVSVNAALVSVLHVDFPANIGDTSQLKLYYSMEEYNPLHPLTSTEFQRAQRVFIDGNLSSQNTDTFH